LVWRTTDGVNLSQFEKEATYDAVISTQVIEHLHPDDLVTHFSNALALLKPGGICVFDTPHRGTGPHDLSDLLGFERPQFMHLKEYDYCELRDALKKAGFSKLEALANYRIFLLRGRALFFFYAAVDRFISFLKISPPLERRIRRSMPFRLLGPRSNIWIAAGR